MASRIRRMGRCASLYLGSMTGLPSSSEPPGREDVWCRMDPMERRLRLGSLQARAGGFAAAAGLSIGLLVGLLAGIMAAGIAYAVSYPILKLRLTRQLRRELPPS
jgi:hypothetical protein